MAQQSKEAPGDLALVRAFVNTLDIDEGLDDVATPDELSAWLTEQRPALRGREAPRRRTCAGRRCSARRSATSLLEQQRRPARCPSRPRRTNDVAARARLRLRVDEDGAARLEAEGRRWTPPSAACS